MRLLQVIPYFLPATAFGGPVTVCAQIARGMVARGHSVTVLTTDVASRTERTASLRETIDGIEIVRVKNRSMKLVQGNLWTPMGLAATARELLRSADVVHVHEFFTWLTYRVTAESVQAGRPVVFSGHGGMSLESERGRQWVKQPMYWLFGRQTIQRFTAVQAATQHEAQIGERLGVNPDKIRVIPNGVAFSTGSGARFRQKYQLGDRDIVLFVGRVATYKGIDLLLDLKLPNAAIVIVGPPENRPDFATPGWRSDDVLWTGPLDRAELDDAYAAATLFALPSQSEGLPMTALEAMAHAVPVVLSEGCHLPEVEEAGAGRVVPLDQFAEAVKALLENRGALAEMSAHAAQLARDRFELGKVLDAYERLYQDLARA